MLLNADDVIALTRNGISFAETLSTNDINALVFYGVSTVIPPYSNGCIRCRMQRRKHTLAGVVCLDHYSITDPYTPIATHMKDL